MRYFVPAVLVLLTLNQSVAAETIQTSAPAPVAPVAMIPSSFADLATHVQDAVVNISTTQKMTTPFRTTRRGKNGQPQPMVPMPFPPGSPFQDFFEDFFNGQNGMPNGLPQIAPNMGQSPDDPTNQDNVVDDIDPLPKVQSLGSGFIIDAKKGLVVTNNHVISDADEIKVILHDDTQLDAKIVGRDPETDLAILKVTTDKQLHDVAWGDSNAMRVGDWVLAVGNPFGLGGTVTAGIISARQRNINAGRYDDFIQTDASINRGNSGGPMFNLRGQVIGINTAIFSPSGGSVGIGFAIPSALAKPTIDQLIDFGKTKRGWIGVKIQEVTPDIADSLGVKGTKGALVANVTTDGPAAKAGVKQGDIITAFNNQHVTEMRHLPRIVAETPIDKDVPVTVLRAGKDVTVTLKTGQLERAKEEGLLDTDQPSDKADKAPKKDDTVAVPRLALSVRPITLNARQQYHLDAAVAGVLVARVEQNGDAADKGIRRGDVILEINQRAVKTPDDVLAAVKQAASEQKPSVLLLVSAQNNLRFVAVKLADDKKPTNNKVQK